MSIFTLSGSMNHKIKQRSKLRKWTRLRFKNRDLIIEEGESTEAAFLVLERTIEVLVGGEKSPESDPDNLSQIRIQSNG